MVKQWLAMIFLGAVNIERSKLLDFDGLSVMLGRTLRGRRPQRLQLGARACTEAADQLLVLNAREVNAQNYSDFYYDAHTKHYTGPLKTLKGGMHLTAPSSRYSVPLYGGLSTDAAGI